MEFGFASWFVVICWVVFVRRRMSNGVVGTTIDSDSLITGIQWLDRRGSSQRTRGGHFSRLMTGLIWSGDLEAEIEKGRRTTGRGKEKVEYFVFCGQGVRDFKISIRKSTRFDQGHEATEDDAIRGIHRTKTIKTMDATKDKNKAIDRRWQFKPP